MPDPPQAKRNARLAVQLGLQLSQRQIGLRYHPIHYLTLRFGAGPPLTPRLMRYPLGLPITVPLRGNLLRPANAHQETIRKFFQRFLALIIGQQKFTAQVIPIWLRHRFTCRRVSPIASLHYYRKYSNTVKIPESRTQADILPMLIVNVRDESDPMRSHACNEALALIASAH